MSKTIRILISDDDPIVHQSLSLYLDNEDFLHDSAYDGRQALDMIKKEHYDLMLLDQMMPGMTGMEVCQAVRKDSQLPIIMLTARGEEIDRILGLEMGADDYIAKPFGMGELLACVRAQLRRRALINPETPEPAVDIGDVHVDLGARTVTQNGEPVHRTKLEYRLLQILIESRGKVLTQRQLLQRVWGPAYVERPHYLRIYMSRLRAKLEDDPARPKWLLTEVGVGCRLAL